MRPGPQGCPWVCFSKITKTIFLIVSGILITITILIDTIITIFTDHNHHVHQHNDHLAAVGDSMRALLWHRRHIIRFSWDLTNMLLIKCIFESNFEQILGLTYVSEAVLDGDSSHPGSLVRSLHSCSLGRPATSNKKQSKLFLFSFFQKNHNNLFQSVQTMLSWVNANP